MHASDRRRASGRSVRQAALLTVALVARLLTPAEHRLNAGRAVRPSGQRQRAVWLAQGAGLAPAAS